MRHALLGFALRASTHHALKAVVLVGLSVGFTLSAEARVGGGQGFSSGSGGSSGRGGGDGEILVDIFFLLIHLAIEYPAIGVPLLLLFIAGIAIRVMFFSGGRPSYEDRGIGVEKSGRPTRGGHTSSTAQGLAKIRTVDPGFSVPVFLEFAAMVHRRALEASTTNQFDAIAPFASESVQQALVSRFGRRRVRDIVVGATRLVSLVVKPEEHRAEVEFEANYTLGDGDVRYVVTRWAFRRAGTAASLPPDETIALGCPNCGNPVETTPLGACTTCGSPITAGQLQWQATDVQTLSSRPVRPPELRMFSGGEERSVSIPTVVQDEFVTKIRRFIGRHPDFDKARFKQRVEDVYLAIQAAWSHNQWDDARPYVTDPLFQQLRFWIEDYVRSGLRNQLEDVALDSVRIVALDEDAWYETLTVRIYGSMKDSTIDSSGTVVAGNPNKTRKFSEYWTFLRASGTGAGSKPSNTCPSCGAPLDKIGSTGICGYCDSKITTGRFDWVLSRIEQCEVYRG